MRFGVPRELEQVCWYGRGPHECYPDRKASARLGVHGVPSVAALHTPYIFPSACAARVSPARVCRFEAHRMPRARVRRAVA